MLTKRYIFRFPLTTNGFLSSICYILQWLVYCFFYSGSSIFALKVNTNIMPAWFMHLYRYWQGPGKSDQYCLKSDARTTNSHGSIFVHLFLFSLGLHICILGNWLDKKKGIKNSSQEKAHQVSICKHLRVMYRPVCCKMQYPIPANMAPFLL